MPEEDDDGEEVETIPLRSTQPEQSTSVSSSSVSPELSTTLGVFLLEHSDLFLSSEDD
ncbi:16946_t:CDS:2, partial [Funneliformis geosporum]